VKLHLLNVVTLLPVFCASACCGPPVDVTRDAKYHGGYEIGRVYQTDLRPGPSRTAAAGKGREVQSTAMSRSLWVAGRRIVFAAWRFLAGLTRPARGANARRLRGRGESAASVAIREATQGDVPALAALHVETWNATYAPLRMSGPGYDVRERQWREAFARNDGSWFCFVAERPDGRLVGFAKGTRSDHPQFGGELNKIYLLREYQGVGLGRRLVGHVARRFLADGIHSMWLFGDARNPSARVWVALGAVKTDDDPGNGNYGWHDLRPLAAACGDAAAAG
jgi:L-amino acid N-acyltransferase YncA